MREITKRRAETRAPHREVTSMKLGLGLKVFTGVLIFTVLPVSACGTPGSPPVESGSSKPEAGDTGSWELLNADQITPASTTVRIGVTRTSCASGITGTVLEPEIKLKATRIVIRAVLEVQKPGGYTCQSNDLVPITVELPRPIGQLALFDAACLDSHNLTTAFCADDAGVRWKP